MKVQFTRISGNQKTGPIPVSTTESSSCPETCTWKEKGCYAKYGPLAMHWRKLDQSEEGLFSWKQFIANVRSLFPGQLWRHNQAGDLPGKNTRIDKRKMMELINANKGRKGFTYTHKPVLGESKQAAKNRDLVSVANAKGFTVNLSADNVALADQLCDLAIAPVVCVLPADAPKALRTPQGRAIVSCPAEHVQYMNCSLCRMCQDKNRNFIVGFHAHGTAKKSVSKRASLPIVE